jgi:hypothetical protein
MTRSSLCSLAGMILAVAAPLATAQIFTPVDMGFEGVLDGSLCWGDYDNDGDLDLFVCGEYAPGEMSSTIYRNDEGEGFVAAVSLFGVTLSDAAWGDYDNDGDLDLALTGLHGPSAFSMLYRNDGAGQFVPRPGVLPHLAMGAVAWGDYDNDGDLDLLLAGYAGAPTTYLLRNDGDDSFVPVATPLFGMYLGAVSWSDYDGDGELDVLISGKDVHGYPTTQLCRNEGDGVFVESGVDLIDLAWTSIDWGDYDDDGDLDLLMTGVYGQYNEYAVTRLYRNDGGVLVEVPAGLPDLGEGCARWGDYDNDGDLDVLISGWRNMYGDRTFIYRNEDGTFVQAGDQINWCGSPVGWGDYDNDGDLDFVQLCEAQGPQVLLYRNDGGFPANTAPAAPDGLQAQFLGDTVRLTWNPSTDAETPTTGLSYNLRIGTQPAGVDMLSPMADPSSGWRHLPAVGNAGQAIDRTLVAFPSGVYYWSVQAVDGGFAGSLFATESVLVIPGADVPDPAIEMPLKIRMLPSLTPLERNVTLEFDLPEAAHARVVLLDLTGRTRMTIFSGHCEAGRHRTSFDMGGLAAGVYFCRLSSGDLTAVCRLLQVPTGQR